MNQFYRKQIYLIQLFMRGCIWYEILILFGYQKCMETGEFHPWKMLLLFSVMFLLWAVSGIRRPKLRIALLVVISCVFLTLNYLPWYFILMETVFAFAGTMKNKHTFEFGVFWEIWLYKVPGILLMLVLLLLHRLWTDVSNPNLAYSPSYAGRFMLAAWTGYLVLYMVNLYMKNFFMRFRYRKSEITGEMFKRTKRSNYAMMIILGVCGLIGMAVFTLIPMGFYNAVLSALKTIAGFILGLILPELQNKEISQMQNAEYLGNPGAYSPASSGSAAAGDGKIFIYIIGAALLVMAFFALKKLFKDMLGQYRIETDTAEFISIREEKEEVYRDEKKGRFSPAYGKSNREKIRKMYYQRILKQLKRQPPERREKVSDSHTPEELSHLLSSTPAEKNHMDEMTFYYEQARFGFRECSDEDVEAVKRLL